MGYTIAQVAEKTNLTAHTLRYYDKEGLLPFIERSNSGNRNFTDSDLERLEIICCLKNTGMSIKKIKEYIEWCIEGGQTAEKRRQMLINHRKEVVKQMNDLQKSLDKIDYKINHYYRLGECN
jgi:DNA-binding transcriptional MerR regulator